MRGLRIRITLLMLTDVGCMSATVFVILAMCHLLWKTAFLPHEYMKLWPVLIFFVAVNAFIRLYHGNIFYPGAPLNPVEELRRLFFSSIASSLFACAYITLSRDSDEIIISRLVVMLGGVVCALTLPIFRFWVRKIMKMFDFGQQNAIILGAGLTGQVIAKELDSDIHFGLRIKGIFDDNINESPNEVPVLGKVQDCIAYSYTNHINYCICCLPITCATYVSRQLSRHFLYLTFIPDVKVFPVSVAYPFCLHGHPGIELYNQAIQRGPQIFKRLLEFLLALIAILFALPLFLILSLVVKMSDSGPVFYGAPRLGKNGKNIKVWKFRTMYANADAHLEQLLANNPDKRAEWQANFKLDDDPRITPIGKYLRKSSLDELPQMWNVLKGDMAIIGPRPIVTNEVKLYGEYYELLKSVKPGITGLWQVSGRSNVDYTLRVNLDVNYILNWTIWMDYYILLKTIREIISCRGAK